MRNTFCMLLYCGIVLAIQKWYITWKINNLKFCVNRMSVLNKSIGCKIGNYCPDAYHQIVFSNGDDVFLNMKCSTYVGFVATRVNHCERITVTFHMSTRVAQIIVDSAVSVTVCPAYKPRKYQRSTLLSLLGRNQPVTDWFPLQRANDT